MLGTWWYLGSSQEALSFLLPSWEPGFPALVHTALQPTQIQRFWFPEPQPDLFTCESCSGGPVTGWSPQNLETNRFSRLSWELMFKDQRRVDLQQGQIKGLSSDHIIQWYLQDLGHLVFSVRLDEARSNLAPNTATDGAATASLICIYNLYLPCFSLKPLPCVLSLQPLMKRSGSFMYCYMAFQTLERNDLNIFH